MVINRTFFDGISPQSHYDDINNNGMILIAIVAVRNRIGYKLYLLPTF